MGCVAAEECSCRAYRSHLAAAHDTAMLRTDTDADPRHYDQYSCGIDNLLSWCPDGYAQRNGCRRGRAAAVRTCRRQHPAAGGERRAASRRSRAVAAAVEPRAARQHVDGTAGLSVARNARLSRSATAVRLLRAGAVRDLDS